MGNRRTERPPDPVLCGGRPSGGFVNSAVMRMNYTAHMHWHVPFVGDLSETVQVVW